MKSTSTFAILRCRSIFLIRPSIFFNDPGRIVITSFSDIDTWESYTSISLLGDSIIRSNQSASCSDSGINCYLSFPIHAPDSGKSKCPCCKDIQRVVLTNNPDPSFLIFSSRSSALPTSSAFHQRTIFPENLSSYACQSSVYTHIHYSSTLNRFLIISTIDSS